MLKVEKSFVLPNSLKNSLALVRKWCLSEVSVLIICTHHITSHVNCHPLWRPSSWGVYNSIALRSIQFEVYHKRGATHTLYSISLLLL